MIVSAGRSKKHPDSVVFHDVSWGFYRAMLKEFDEVPSRINFDRGTLEVMTLSLEHEAYKSFLGLMLGQISLVFRLLVKNGGSTTLKRMTRMKGLEADQCYWVQNESKIRGKKRIDLRTDPPPDLVIEIDVMHSVVNRENIYAKLGVPEMWIVKRDASVHAYRLEAGKWLPIDQSVALPMIRPADLGAFVARLDTEPDTLVLADFNTWLLALKASLDAR